MKKGMQSLKILKIVFVILGLCVICYFGFLFLSISFINYFSNAKRIELLPEEKILFERLKNKYGFEEIVRTPETEKRLLYPKDTLSYTLYIDYIDCNKEKEYYKPLSDSIFVEIKHNIKLDPKFYKYEIIFYCKNGTLRVYEFSKLKKDI